MLALLVLRIAGWAACTLWRPWYTLGTHLGGGGVCVRAPSLACSVLHAQRVPCAATTCKVRVWLRSAMWICSICKSRKWLWRCMASQLECRALAYCLPAKRVRACEGGCACGIARVCVRTCLAEMSLPGYLAGAAKCGSHVSPGSHVPERLGNRCESPTSPVLVQRGCKNETSAGNVQLGNDVPRFLGQVGHLAPSTNPRPLPAPGAGIVLFVTRTPGICSRGCPSNQLCTA